MDMKAGRMECHFDGNGYYRWGVQTDKSIDYETVFPASLIPDGKRKDEYENLRFKRVPNPAFGKQIDDGMDGIHEDTRQYTSIVLEPQTPTTEQIETIRVLKVKQIMAKQLPELIYENKDNPALLSQALCDKMNEINLESKAVEK